MWNALAVALNLNAYPEPTRRNRALIAYTAVAVITLFFTLYAFLVPYKVIALAESEMLTYMERATRPSVFPLYTVSLFAFYLLGLYTLWHLRRGNLERVTLAPSAMIYVGATSVALVNNVAYAQNGYLLLPPLLIAGLLGGGRGLLIFTPLHFVLLVFGYTQFIGMDDANQSENLILLVITSITMVGLLYLYLRLSQLGSREAEAGVLQQRLQIAGLTTRITRSATEPTTLSEALSDIVEDIRQTFPEAYHAQVFLLDEAGRNAQLFASTGEPGRQLLEIDHSLPVGGSSVIGFVTQQKRAYRTVVGDESRVHRPNPYLPDTRVEAAFPMAVGERNIGALDVQSNHLDAFGPIDMTTFQAIADSIAVTINNTRLLESAAADIQQNKELTSQLADREAEVAQLKRELTGSIWKNYLQKGNVSYNLDLDFEAGQQTTSEELSEALLDAITRDDISRKDVNGQQAIAVPLRVRGEVIGAMEFEVDGGVTGADIDMLQEVAERFGIAAENNRLYDNSQRLAQREALVNQISTRIQSANSVDATLAEAARSLRDALKAQRVAIRLGTSNNPVNRQE